MNSSFTALSSTAKRASSRIHYWMEHHPITSNSLLCLNLWVAGDLLAQYSEQRLKLHPQTPVPRHTERDSHKSTQNKNDTTLEHNRIRQFEESFWSTVDLTRTVKCASFGAFFTGPVIALWYPYMDRVCSQFNITKRYGLWGAPILKVLADEFIMDPPCLVAFFGYMNIWEGGNWPQFYHKLQTQFFPAWYTSLAVWPTVLLAAFRFLPVALQAPVINVCCIVWDGFLSYRNTLSNNSTEDSTSS